MRKIVLFALILSTSFHTFARVGTTMQKINFAKKVINENLPSNMKIIESTLNIKSRAFDALTSVAEYIVPGEADFLYVEFICIDSNGKKFKSLLDISTESVVDPKEDLYSYREKLFDPMTNENFIIYTDNNYLGEGKIQLPLKSMDY